MARNSLSGLVIRSGVVRAPDLGFILACDPKKEEEEIQHTIAFRWKNGIFNRGEAKFSAHSCCIIEAPEYGVVKIAGSGIYSVETRNGVTVGNVFRDSNPSPQLPRHGDIRSVVEVAGTAYAVGLEGMVYRLDQLSRWTRIDEGLPSSFDIEATHGFRSSDLYAAGRRGELWHFNGHEWRNLEVPTNITLATVKCAADGKIYLAGHGGLLLYGRDRSWEVIEHGGTNKDIWDLEWFEGILYVSTMSNVYRLSEGSLEVVDFGVDRPKTFYQLSAASGVLWSIGEKDVMSFDGRNWTRIV